jgi:hypothetical protein
MIAKLSDSERGRTGANCGALQLVYVTHASAKASACYHTTHDILDSEDDGSGELGDPMAEMAHTGQY